MQNIHATIAKMRQSLAEQGIEVPKLTPEQMAERQHQADVRMMRQWQAQQRDLWRKDSLWSGNQPLRFTFDRWDPKKQRDSSLAFDLGKRAFYIADEMKKHNFNVLMVGKQGTGKTSLALAIAEKLAVEENRKNIFISTMALARLFSNQYRDDGQASERLRRLFKQASRTKLLVLDDFGTEAGMKAYTDQGQQFYKPVRKDMQDWLFDLANARYDEQNNGHFGSTIITTNYTGNELLQMYHPKLISRLVTKQKEHILNFKGLEDVRA